MNKGVVARAVKSFIYYLNQKEKRYVVVIFILQIFSSVLDVFGLASLVPIIMAASSPQLIIKNKYLGYLYNFFHFQNEKLFLLFLIIGIFLFFAFKNLFTTWINYKQVQFTANIALKIINRQFDKYANLPFWHFNHEGSARMINNVLGIPQYYVSGIIRPTFVLFSEIFIISIVVFGIFLYQPLLFIVLLVVMVPSAILTFQLLKNRSEKIGNKLHELRPPALNILSNSFNGFVELKLANKIEDFKQRFISNQKEVQALEAKSYLFSLLPLKMIEMVAILGICTIFIFIIFFAHSAENLISIIGLFAAAAYRLMPSLNRLLTSLVLLKQNEIAIKELEVYRAYELRTSNQYVNQPLKFDDSICFEKVSFSFPGEKKPTLQQISLKIKKGEKVGFIGISGSGKTTLMNILLRFYVEQEGKIFLDSIHLTEQNKLAWYNLIGYVKQDTFLMDSSIKDNITLADPIVDAKRLEYALEQASLTDFVNSLPNKENTLIGEKGSKLSGGQKQRIGIARALYKKTQVLILDEATSALDTITEREVSEAIDKLSQTDMTILIIAHRVTTLRDCDRIFEMGNGKIIAERTYNEVVQNLI